MISIRDLVVRFGDLRAVDGVTLDIPEGCLFGFLGPNGAGKSTTIACMAGLQTPSAGQVLVGGVGVAADPARARRLLGVVPQGLALYPTLSVVQNLRIFGGLFGVQGRALSQRVDWGLALAQLTGRENTIVDTLSGGMKRRLNLACALLHDPPVIICDEPTTGVDPQSRNHLFDTIRNLHQEGRTVVYTTHYMEEVEALCSRVAIIDHGRVLVNTSLAELLEARETPTRFQVQLADGMTPQALEASLRAQGLAPTSVQAEHPGLEQVFLELTGRRLRDGA